LGEGGRDLIPGGDQTDEAFAELAREGGRGFHRLESLCRGPLAILSQTPVGEEGRVVYPAPP